MYIKCIYSKCIIQTTIIHIIFIITIMYYYCCKTYGMYIIIEKDMINLHNIL